MGASVLGARACGVPLLSRSPKNQELASVDDPFDALPCPDSPYLFVGRIGKPPYLLRQAQGKVTIASDETKKLIGLISAQGKSGGLPSTE
jgi:hypothetical protein